MARRMDSHPIYYKQVPPGDNMRIDEVIFKMLNEPGVPNRDKETEIGALCDIYILTFDSWDNVDSYGLSTIIALPIDKKSMIRFRAQKILDSNGKKIVLERSTIPIVNLGLANGYKLSLQKVASNQPYQRDFE